MAVKDFAVNIEWKQNGKKINMLTWYGKISGRVIRNEIAKYYCKTRRTKELNYNILV